MSVDFILVSGIILFIFPFSLVFLFPNRLKGVLVASIFLLGFAIIVPVLTQVLHIFGYFSVCSSYVVLDVIVLFLFLKKQRYLSNIKFSIPFIIALAIVSFELTSLHYWHTGQVQTLDGTTVVVDDSYAYPIFSDEWVEAATASYSIHTQALPIRNPLAENTPMPNLLLPFDSLLAGLFVLFGLSPISNFAILAIAFGVAISMSVYAAARCFGVGRFASVIAFLSIPFIVNGANLPGVWFLLPYIASAAPFFLMLACLGKKEYKLAGVAAFISLLLYPPFAIFILPATIASAFFTKKLGLMSWPFAVAAILGMVFLILEQDSSAAFSFIQKAIFHFNLDPGIPSYAMWNVIPIFIIPFIFIGFADLLYRKIFTIIAPVLIGIVYWILYAFYPNVVIIEYPRIVVITSLVLILVAAFGFDLLFRYLARYCSSKYLSSNVYAMKRMGAVIVIAIFAFAALRYPFGQEWQTFSIPVKAGNGTQFIIPNLPLNHYLAPDDLAIWQGISGKNFTAPPWKGLVIGAATHNYPLESKPSVITMSIMPYAKFMAADCPGKDALAGQYSISYAYSMAFKCSNFVELGQSSEGLHLYEYEPLVQGYSQARAQWRSYSIVY